MNIMYFCKKWVHGLQCQPCMYLRWPKFQAGYTGKSGVEASHYCQFHHMKAADVKHCHEYRAKK